MPPVRWQPPSTTVRSPTSKCDKIPRQFIKWARNDRLGFLLIFLQLYHMRIEKIQNFIYFLVKDFLRYGSSRQRLTQNLWPHVSQAALDLERWCFYHLLAFLHALWVYVICLNRLNPVRRMQEGLPSAWNHLPATAVVVWRWWHLEHRDSPLVLCDVYCQFAADRLYFKAFIAFNQVQFNWSTGMSAYSCNRLLNHIIWRSMRTQIPFLPDRPRPIQWKAAWRCNEDNSGNTVIVWRGNSLNQIQWLSPTFKDQ